MLSYLRSAQAKTLLPILSDLIDKGVFSHLLVERFLLLLLRNSEPHPHRHSHNTG
jgi:hypothetical protein